MKELFFALFFIFLSSNVFAQSTANQTQPGYLTTSGCPNGLTSCFVPYSASNPLPVTIEGGGTGTVSSVGNMDGSLTVSPTTGDVIASINYGNAGTWSALQTFGAGILDSANGAASFSPFMMTGTVFTGGNGTTTVPYFLLNPSGSTAVTTWSTLGTLFGVTAPSTFTGFLMDVRNSGGTSYLSISNGGTTTVGALNITAVPFSLAATSTQTWTGRARIQSPADGILEFNNNAATGFTRLEFGGTTSSFPALAVNGTGLEAQLADASADTTLKTSGIISGGTTFSVSGCTTVSNIVGGSTAGSFSTSTIGTCTAVITLGGITAPNGWDCAVNDRTTANLFRVSASTQTTVTLSGTSALNDVISFHCEGY